MKRKLLFEVSIIRPFIITLLVVYHSFCPWGGQWLETQCLTECNFYYWLTKIISGFRIETIALVAGYVFAYQCISLNRKYEFVPFALKKLKRLYIPCLFFGTIYYFMYYYDGLFNVLDFAIRVSSGAGHLWFLPMLFWCFILLWIIDRYSPNKIVTFIALSFMSIMPIPIFIPFGLNRAFHFFFWCYAGYLLWIYKDIIVQKFSKAKHITALLLIYITVVISRDCISTSFVPVSIFEKGGHLLLLALLKYITTASGIMALYLTVCKHIGRPGFRCSTFVIHLSSVCYGVYVFHQFILKYLYYYTDLPCIMGLWLPWVGCIVTLLLSYMLTSIFLKFKIGRYLIG